MTIRSANYKDAPGIKLLLSELGYSSSISLLINQLETIFSNADNHVFVYEHFKEVVGFISVHYLPQLALNSELVFISCFSVDRNVRNPEIAKTLEEYVIQQAVKRKCELIQIKCQDMRITPDKFYEQQGYKEYPGFYMKTLVYNK